MAPEQLVRAELSREDAFRKLANLLRSFRPDAIVTTSESAAAGVTEGLRLLGFSESEIPVCTLGEEHWNRSTHSFALYSAARPAIRMFFTSGTTGYPKIATHSYKYPLGHYVTARFWHWVRRDGLHFTISDTGWGKALWGKLYGQCLCEGAVFTYDFDRFDASKILPMFAKYHITTFCAPPTMYRMFFTSGTSGYPKIAAHNYLYPLGHFITAKYWHCVNPDGLHLTISDTGWAKSLWGKLYGQWLCEAPVFVYDFDRFDAEKILPMFARYQITTFCAPPTMPPPEVKTSPLSSSTTRSTAWPAARARCPPC